MDKKKTLEIILQCVICEFKGSIKIREDWDTPKEYQNGRVICERCGNNKWSVELVLKKIEPRTCVIGKWDCNKYEPREE